METQKNRTALFYIGKQLAVLYKHAQAEPSVLTFRKDVVYHGEVLQIQVFHSLIQDFIAENGIQAGVVFIVLDDSITVERVVKAVLHEEQQKEIEHFLDVVAYEHVLSKVYRTKNTTQVVAVNREIIDCITQEFEKKSIRIKGVVPMTIAKQFVSDISQTVDKRLLLQKVDILTQYTILDNEVTEEKFNTLDRPRIKRARFFILLAVFSALLMALAGVIYRRV